MNFQATRTGALLTLAALAVVGRGAPALAEDAAAKDSPAAQQEDKRVLHGGEEGTVFKSLTVTGEDRVQIEFQRPDLRVDLDPRSAPGLEWGDPMDVLTVQAIDLVQPLRAQTAALPAPKFARPWMDHFQTETVARFQPQLEGVEEWRLLVVDSRSDTVATFSGGRKVPKEIPWNGLSRSGEPVPPGVRCSYVLEARDRAGNPRTFVGEGFELPAYRVDGKNGSSMLFAGPASPAMLLDVATRIDQVMPAGRPVEVKVAAPQLASAEALGQEVASFLKDNTLGDPARIRYVAQVRADAPAAGTVAVVVAPQASAAR